MRSHHYKNIKITDLISNALYFNLIKLKKLVTQSFIDLCMMIDPDHVDSSVLHQEQYMYAEILYKVSFQLINI